MSTPADNLAVDLRNAYEWHDREALENAIQRMKALLQSNGKCSDCPLLQQEMHKNERN